MTGTDSFNKSAQPRKKMLLANDLIPGALAHVKPGTLRRGARDVAPSELLLIEPSQSGADAPDPILVLVRDVLKFALRDTPRSILAAGGHKSVEDLHCYMQTFYHDLTLDDLMTYIYWGKQVTQADPELVARAKGIPAV